MLFAEQAKREILVVFAEAHDRIPAAENLGAVLGGERFTERLPVLQETFLDARFVSGGLLEERGAESLRRSRYTQVGIFHKFERRADFFKALAGRVKGHPSEFELRRAHGFAEAVQPEYRTLRAVFGKVDEVAAARIPKIIKPAMYGFPPFGRE